MTNLAGIFRTAALSASVALLSLSAQNARADAFSVSFLAPGVQSSSSSSFVENFNNSTISNGTLVSTFNGSSITGTYSGGFSVVPADTVGGAGGVGKYITTLSSYTLALSTGVNYFGLWFSALDQGNLLSFYQGSTMVYSFTPSAFISLVGSCPSLSGYCGDPNPNQLGNTSQQYAFLNFYDTSGSFNKIVLTQAATGGFESDNHTVGNIVSTPGGTSVSPVPEPSTLILLGTGLAGLAGGIRRHFRIA